MANARQFMAARTAAWAKAGGGPVPPGPEKPYGVRYVFDIPDNGSYAVAIKSTSNDSGELIDVDWGDGIIEKKSPHPSISGSFASHTYTSDGKYEIIIRNANYFNVGLSGAKLIPNITHNNSTQFSKLNEVSIRVDGVVDFASFSNISKVAYVDNWYLYGTPETITNDVFKGVEVIEIHIPQGTVAAWTAFAPDYADKFIDDLPPL